MNLANPTFGLSATYLAISVVFSFLIASAAAYIMRQRSVTSISYKTFGIIFVVVMTLFVLRKI